MDATLSVGNNSDVHSAISPPQKNKIKFDMLAVLQELHQKYKSLREGKVVDYIPELGQANPYWFSIVVVTVDGQIYQVGDYDQLFTMQSLSKPFVYGLVLEDHGRDYVHTKVGAEPSGEAFNSITLDERSKRPHNPMVNSGAIAVASLIKGKDPTERLNHMMDMFRRYIGEDISIDMPVFISERTTGDRNRAIAYLMRNFKMIDENIDAILDLYFQQCSIMVNCRHLATMAATLANNGVNPITKHQAVESQYVKDILSVMYTCGLYDFAGEWAHDIGLPAKSGIGGGIIAVVPKHFGIASFSPPLDDRGNSVRGIKVCEELSQRFNLHIFDLLMENSRVNDIITLRT